MGQSTAVDEKGIEKENWIVDCFIMVGDIVEMGGLNFLWRMKSIEIKHFVLFINFHMRTPSLLFSILKAIKFFNISAIFGFFLWLEFTTATLFTNLFFLNFSHNHSHCSFPSSFLCSALLKVSPSLFPVRTKNNDEQHEKLQCHPLNHNTELIFSNKTDSKPSSHLFTNWMRNIKIIIKSNWILSHPSLLKRKPEPTGATKVWTFFINFLSFLSFESTNR